MQAFYAAGDEDSEPLKRHFLSMNRIKHHMKRNQLTQERLAELIGQTQGQVSRKINQNTFDLNELQQVARAIGVQAWELLDGTEHLTKLTDDELSVLGDYRELKSRPEFHVLTKTERLLIRAFRNIDAESKVSRLAEIANEAFPESPGHSEAPPSQQALSAGDPQSNPSDELNP